MSILELTQIIRKQHGVISRQQALATGLTPSQIRHRLSTAIWKSLFPGIYLDAHAVVSWTMRAHAAVLALGPDALIVGESAAQLRGWVPRALPIRVSIPAARRTSIRAEDVTVVHGDVPLRERVVIDGLPTTQRLRTAVDIAHYLPGRIAQPILDRLLVLDVVSIVSLTQEIEISKRRGSAQARRLIKTAQDGAAADSERKAKRLFQEAGIKGWSSNYPVTLPGGAVLKVDLALVKLKIAVEIKGWTYHSAPDRARSDDRRVTDLQLLGWIVLPFGWYELTYNPEQVVSTVLAAIAQRESAVA